MNPDLDHFEQYSERMPCLRGSKVLRNPRSLLRG